ncbi:hypothetical protein HYH03_000514 [Edaphochlamys debaryana]|uniref:Uncharacterized protein n=1 Tax=Edaphochlamys debaryana TaxID=47281 RepID=A0A835YHQ3_9CHLO|nr:hypothetical protein HYH03_000514 [Edaphochlamys debaryana]|eukprot:KAG2502019.1 hypothetical protein HYH03_000514 [Edaphochlamys debaryana]
MKAAEWRKARNAASLPAVLGLLILALDTARADSSLWSRNYSITATSLDVANASSTPQTLYSCGVARHQNSSLNAALSQALRLPLSLFARHRCQVVFLANPDWARLSVSVHLAGASGNDTQAEGGAAGEQPSGAAASPPASCAAGEAYFGAYVDGHNAPAGLNRLTLSSQGVPWAALALGGLAATEGAVAEAEAQAKAKKRRRGLAELNRTALEEAGQDVALHVQTMLLDGGGGCAPGPEGALKRPLQQSPKLAGGLRRLASYSPGLLLREVQGGVADGPAPRVAALTDSALAFWAPDNDCLLAADSGRRRPVMAAAAATSAAPAAAADPSGYGYAWDESTSYSVDSCYATQVAVYIYNPCAPAGGPPPATAEPPAAPPPPPGSPSDLYGKLYGINGSQAKLLSAALTLQASAMGQEAEDVEAGGYVLITVSYETYESCEYRTAESLYLNSWRLVVLVSIIGGGLLLALLFPTLWRLLVSFPARVVVHIIRQGGGARGRARESSVGAMGRHAGRPLAAELHSLKGGWAPVPAVATCLRPLAWAAGPLLRGRKHLVYALASVHSADGQSRALQALVISNVSLIVVLIMYWPGTRPPLSYFVPLRVTLFSRTPGGSLSSLAEVLLYSLFFGCLGYFTLVANYNTPTNRYYRTQVVISVLVSCLLYASVGMQMGNLLALWPDISMPWPYLSLVVCQLGCSLPALVLQAIVCSRVFKARSPMAERRGAAKAPPPAAPADGAVAVLIPRLPPPSASTRRRTSGSVSPERASADAATPNALYAGPTALSGPVAESVGASPRARPGPPAEATAAAAVAEGLDGGLDAPIDLRSQPPAELYTAEQGPGAGAGAAVVHAVAAGPSGAQKAEEGHSNPHRPLLESEPQQEARSDSLQPNGGAGSVPSQHPASPASRGVEAKGASSSAGATPSKSRGQGPGSMARQAGGGAGAGEARSPVVRWAAREDSDEDADGDGRERGEGEDDDGGSSSSGKRGGAEEGKGAPKKSLLRRLLRSVQEGPEFRYPAWLLGSLLVAAEMLFFHYGRALAWSDNAALCMQAPAVCAARSTGRYLSFAGTLFDSDAQTRLRSALQRLSATQAVVAGALARNGSAPGALATATATSLTQLSDGLTNAASDLGSLLSGLDPELQARLNASGLAPALSSALAVQGTRLMGLAGAAQASAAEVETGERRWALQAQALGVVEAGLQGVALAANRTLAWVDRTLAVRDRMDTWQKGLRSQVVVTSAVGFTLGLLLGLSTLWQTAAAFRRAVRRSRRMTLLRRIRSAAASAAARGVAGAAAAVAAADSDLRAQYDKMDESALLVRRARAMPITRVVFFLGVLMSTAVVQLWLVGAILTASLTVLVNPWTWSYFLPAFWTLFLAMGLAYVLNKVLFLSYLGGAFLSNGDRIYRPAAWLAFFMVLSALNLIVGLLIAVFRIVYLVMTSALVLGKLEDTLFTFMAGMDLPHNAFLAGLHLHEAMAHFDDPVFLPGPRGRAHRHWRKLAELVRKTPPSELRALLEAAEARASGPSGTQRATSRPALGSGEGGGDEGGAGAV